MTPRDILIGSRDLIRLGWCQGCDARGANGEEVYPWSREACSWSLLGALMAAQGVGTRAIGRLPVDELGRAIVVLGEAASTHSLEAWNDEPERTQATVLRVVDAAITSLATHDEAVAVDPWTTTAAGS